MISGIGPSATLQEHGIKTLKDLPGVGQNLWDQPFFGTTFQVNLNSSVSNALQVSEYHQNPPIGPLTMPGNPSVGWDILPNTSLSPSTREALSQFPSDWPQIEWLAVSIGLGNATEGVYRSIVTALVAPLSRGYVTIRSARMADAPMVNFNYLTHPGDQEVAIGAFKRQREFWSKLNAITIGVENVPGPSVQTDAEILAYIRSVLSPIWHASATCKMGKLGDRMAVVNSRFQVYGTQNLRVVDASVFPFLPPGHPQSTIYALAEKAAAEILEGEN